MRKLALISLLALVGLSGCAGPPPAPLPAEGTPWHALNDYGGYWGSWQPTPAEFNTLPK